jgi:hypothetical protein
VVQNKKAYAGQAERNKSVQVLNEWKELIFMLRCKQRFVCERCGRVFYEYVPDCITPAAAMLLLHPRCSRCRIATKSGKILNKKIV